jgi:holo-[acyl-carrier protein] synthase
MPEPVADPDPGCPGGGPDATPAPAAQRAAGVSVSPGSAPQRAEGTEVTAASAPPRAEGVGVDVVAVTAFAAQLAEPGTRFARAFTPAERRAARRGGRSAAQEAQGLAARWAAKEAVLKAWSSAHFGGPEVIDPVDVDLREIEVVTDAWGRPGVRLHGAIGAALTGRQVLLSLSHDPDADVAIAYVVLQEA